MSDRVFISAYLLKDYMECPKKVYYRINYPDSSVQNQDMAAGSIVHSTLELHWKSRDEARIYALSEIESHFLDPRRASKVVTCVENFFDFFFNIVTEKDLIEYRFKIPYGSRVFLVGKIDRITPLGGMAIDWKTSTDTKGDLSRDPQFILYRYVQKELFGTEESSLIRANLTDGSVTSYVADPMFEYYLLGEVISSAIRSVDNSIYPPTGMFSGKCHRCSYKRICWNKLGVQDELDSSKTLDGH